MSGDEKLVEHKLESLHKGIVRCRKCRLHESRKHAVPGEGPCNAKIMFIGEAPGEIEDMEGKPFRGRSGIFLDKLLGANEIKRHDVFITGSVKCRPPGNRDPKSDELAACRKAWLDNQIEIIKPQLIVLLGRIALRQVLGETGPLGKFRGRIAYHDKLKVLPTYHPAAGMRFPGLKEKMYSDFGIIHQEITS